MRAQLGECARYIVYSDYPERWPGLLQQVYQGLHSQDLLALYGALYVLRLLARKYEFKDEEERAPLQETVTLTFPLLLQIFQVGRVSLGPQRSAELHNASAICVCIALVSLCCSCLCFVLLCFVH